MQVAQQFFKVDYLKEDYILIPINRRLANTYIYKIYIAIYVYNLKVYY